jgi:hypothetical protein
VLTLRDKKDELLAMLITNISQTLPHLETTAIPLFSAVMTGEVYPVNSDEPDFRYCASHKVHWNRYAEQVSCLTFWRLLISNVLQGHDAPKGVHPNQIRKANVAHVNYTQRAPRASDEMKDDPQETELLAEFIKLVTIIIEFHVSERV